jgi:hypothetical protein
VIMRRGGQCCIYIYCMMGCNSDYYNSRDNERVLSSRTGRPQ